jgi:hypothetical protein
VTDSNSVTGSAAYSMTISSGQTTVQADFQNNQIWIGQTVFTGGVTQELTSSFGFNSDFIGWAGNIVAPAIWTSPPPPEPLDPSRLISGACVSGVVSAYGTAGSPCYASNSSVPLQFAGSFDANTVMVSSMGRFSGVSAAFGGNWQRMVFGDFNIQHNSETGSGTSGLNGRVAWQTMTSPKTTLGYFVGGRLAHSSIAGTFNGAQNSIGVSVGGYGVHTLESNLKVTGFFSLGAGQNNLEMTDTVLSLESDYMTRSAMAGGALSGVLEEQGFEVKPELSINVGRTWIGEVAFTGRANGVVDDTLSQDAEQVTLANMMLRSEVRVPMDGLSVAKSLQVMTFAPRLMCEQISTTASEENCGGGAEVGFAGNSEDGLSSVSAKISADRIGGSTRSLLQLGLERRF